MASNNQSASQSSHGAPSANDAQNHSPESPYYIHWSEIDPELFKPTLVLSGSDNYSKWYREMNATLASKKKLGFVDGTITVPAEGDPMYGPWERCNKLVLSWIVKAVSPELEKSVHGMDQAVDAWRDLKDRFSLGDDRLNSDIRDDIQDDICSLRQGERTVASYFTEFCLLWDKKETFDPLTACACVTTCSCDAMERVKKREEDKVRRFLRGLDDRFDAARSRIRQENPLPSIVKVFTWVVQEETQTVSGANQTTQQSQGPKRHHSQPPSICSASTAAIPDTQPEKEAITGTKKQPLVLPNHIHPHPLTLMEPGEPYECSGCQELGFGSSYRCESNKCSYVLHEDCGHAVLDKSPVHHPFFEEDKFSFSEKPRGRPRLCDACRKEVRGFVYHRPDNGHPNDTGLDLHPCCLKLKDGITCEEGNVTKTLKLRRTIPQKCLKCNSRKVEKDESKVKGWSYVSSDESYCFHVSCFKELIVGKMKQGYFSEIRMSVVKYDPETQRPLTSKEMTKAAGSSKGSGAIKIATKITVVVLKVIFAVIFGNPTSLILDLLELAFPAGINWEIQYLLVASYFYVCVTFAVRVFQFEY